MASRLPKQEITSSSLVGKNIKYSGYNSSINGGNYNNYRSGNNNYTNRGGNQRLQWQPRLRLSEVASGDTPTTLVLAGGRAQYTRSTHQLISSLLIYKQSQLFIASHARSNNLQIVSKLNYINGRMA
ncbi:hypothetical protein OUZ56_017113 [Daphnia magna]|uniref:Uncharacterized protein n=1 Tax=Daphnia magna TaxID=35525 RepID=A0ABR0AS68_9CRUS|nr:hypothetical protein OUZ56_017113 [Daphnia magna]